MNLEHNNDLCKIRHELNNNGFQTPISQLPNIENQLKKRNIKYNKYDSDDKELHITPQEVVNNKNHWLYPFLMGCAYKDYATIYSERKRSKIYNLAKQHLQTIDKIDINETTVFTEIRH